MAQAISYCLAPSTLHTYHNRLLSISSFALTCPTTFHTECEMVERFLVQELAAGRAPSTIRNTLSAVTFLHTLGAISWEPPRTWWKLSAASSRLLLHVPAPRVWFTLPTLTCMAQACQNTSDLRTLAVIILSLTCGLRFGEAASISPTDFSLTDSNQITFHIRSEKTSPLQNPTTTRLLQPYPSMWARYLLFFPSWPQERPYHSPYSLRTSFLHLQNHQNTAPPLPFHSLRRACSRFLHLLGFSTSHTAAWCRWKSPQQALHYAGTLSPSDLPSSFLAPFPPLGFSEHLPVRFVPSSPGIFWESPAPPSDVPDSTATRANKRSR